MTKSLLHCCASLLCALFFLNSAFAAPSFSGGTGSSDSPYLISSRADLDALAQTVNAGTTFSGQFLKLTADIDLSIPLPGETDTQWIPIGTNTTPFNGTFNGDSHVISNLYFNDTTKDYIGFFGYTNGAKIYNLGLRSIQIIAKDKVGGIMGFNSSSSSVSNCCASGSVTGNSYIGGISGFNRSGKITNCYVTSAIQGNDRIGGISGDNYYSFGIVTNCYVAGTIQGKTNVGGISGFAGSGNITHCYYDKRKCIKLTNTQGMGQTSEWLKSEECVCTLNFNAVNSPWRKDVHNLNDGYPVLSWQSDDGKIEPCFESGLGTSDSPYVISSRKSLYNLSLLTNSGANFSGKFFKLTADIDLSIPLPGQTDTQWIPIGTYATSFSGTFNGDSHVISNLYFNDTTRNYIGFFGRTSGAKISNLGLKNVQIVANDYIGGIFGENAGTTATVTNCYVSGTIQGNSKIGGMSGNDGTFTNCYVTGSIQGNNNVGGITGSNGSFTDCYNAGGITGNTNVGGITGSGGDVTNCYYNKTKCVKLTNIDGMGQTNEWFKSEECISFLRIQATNSPWRKDVHNLNDGYPVLSWQSDDGKVEPYAFESGAGTSNSPYQISTRKSLHDLSVLTNAGMKFSGQFFNLTSDIDLSIPLPGETDTQWLPIGNVVSSFRGTFNGDSHIISNLYFNDATRNYTGFFGRTNGAKISNLGLKNVQIAANNNVGGIFGENTGNNTTVTNCYVTGTIQGNNNVGGIVGYAYSRTTVTNCYVTGTIQGNNNIGGLSGNNATFWNCYNTAAINGNTYVGGIIGYQGTLTNCYNTGDVRGSDNVGGICGYQGNITRCYNAGAVTGNTNVGGITTHNSATVTNCYYDKTKCIKPTNSHGMGQSSEWLKSEECVSFLRIQATNSPWRKDVHNLNDGYPVLSWQSDDGKIEPYAFESGNGTTSSPYVIGSQKSLYNLSTLTNGGTAFSGQFFKLTADIDLSIPLPGETDTQWLPIGKFVAPFSGTFNGDSHVISNLYFNDTTRNYIGFFGRTNGAKISNLGLKNVQIIANDYIGGIFGENTGTTATVTNCYVTGSIQGNNNVGGLSGSSGTFTNCYNVGTVTGNTKVGGIIGGSGTVTNCYNMGTVSGKDYVAGILANYGTIANCYNAGTITGSTNTGAICGYGSTNGGTVTNCYYDKIKCRVNNWRAMGQTSEWLKSEECVSFLRFKATNSPWRKDVHNLNNGYPVLSWQSNDGKIEPYAFESGTGTTSSPYQVSLRKSLYDLSVLTSAGVSFNGQYFKLTTDIDLSIPLPGQTDTQWIPIGTTSGPFSGIFDGDSHIISNLYNNTGRSYIGFFGCTSSGNISNLRLQNIWIAGYDYIGGIVGSTNNYTSITNCYVTGTIQGRMDVGGITGTNDGNYSLATITGCYNTASITGDRYVGGISGDCQGFNASATIKNCYNMGPLFGNSNVGGISGTHGTLTNCYNAGPVSGTTSIGGISGYGGTVTNCYYDVASCKVSNGKGIGMESVGMKTEDFAVTLNANQSPAVWVYSGEYPKLAWEEGVYVNSMPPFLDTGCEISWRVVNLTVSDSDIYRITINGKVVVEDLPLQNDRSFVWDIASYDDGTYEFVFTFSVGSEIFTQKRRCIINRSPNIAIHNVNPTANEVWEKSKIHVIASSYTIPSGVSIEIEPGSIVKFCDMRRITVLSGGTLKVGGVVFTTITDDTEGGDTNGDGSTSAPAVNRYSFAGSGTITDDTYTRYKYLTTTLSTTIAGNVRLRNNAIYLVKNSITIQNNGTLTIPPGTILKFATGCSLIVNFGGKLFAEGTLYAPVVLTSIHDDIHGGDTNENGNATRPQPGDWEEIRNNGGEIYFKYVKVMYSGYGQYTNQRDASLRIESGKCDVQNSEFVASALRHIYAGSDSVTVENTLLRDARTGTEGKGTFRHCVFYDCTTAAIGGNIHNSIIAKCNARGGAKFSYCNVWKTPGTVSGTLTAHDPMFKDAENGDFRLSPRSPLVDAGDGTQSTETDYYGQKRIKYPFVNGTGIPNDSGIIPDIGLYELVDGSPSNIDLEVVHVTNKMSDKLGKELLVTYTVVNKGTQSAKGILEDALIFSDTIPTEKFTMLPNLIQNVVNIEPGQSISLKHSLKTPFLLPGKYFFGIKTNVNNKIYEGVNLVDSKNIGFAVSSVNIVVGQTDSIGQGSFELFPNQNTYFYTQNLAETIHNVIFNAPEGSKVYYRYNAPPSLESYTGLIVVDASQIVSIPLSPNDYLYIMVVGPKNHSKTEIINVSQNENRLTCEEAFPNEIPQKSCTTLLLAGDGFTENMNIKLSRGNKEIKALSHYYISTKELNVTFNTDNFPIGEYDLILQDTIFHQDYILPNAVSITKERISTGLWTKLDAPKASRAGRKNQGVIYIANVGNTDVSAPVLMVKAPGATFEENAQYNNDNAYFVALSNTHPRGVLKVGEVVAIEFEFSPGPQTKELELFVIPWFIPNKDPEKYWADIESTLLFEEFSDIPDLKTKMAKITPLLYWIYPDYISTVLYQKGFNEKISIEDYFLGMRQCIISLAKTLDSSIEATPPQPQQISEKITVASSSSPWKTYSENKNASIPGTLYIYDNGNWCELLNNNILNPTFLPNQKPIYIICHGNEESVMGNDLKAPHNYWTLERAKELYATHTVLGIDYHMYAQYYPNAPIMNRQFSALKMSEIANTAYNNLSHALLLFSQTHPTESLNIPDCFAKSTVMGYDLGATLANNLNQKIGVMKQMVFLNPNIVTTTTYASSNFLKPTSNTTPTSSYNSNWFRSQNTPANQNYFVDNSSRKNKPIVNSKPDLNHKNTPTGSGSASTGSTSPRVLAINPEGKLETPQNAPTPTALVKQQKKSYEEKTDKEIVEDAWNSEGYKKYRAERMTTRRAELRRNFQDAEMAFNNLSEAADLPSRGMDFINKHAPAKMKIPKGAVKIKGKGWATLIATGADGMAKLCNGLVVVNDNMAIRDEVEYLRDYFVKNGMLEEQIALSNLPNGRGDNTSFLLLRPCDPNEMAGPDGKGSGRFVNAGDWMEYTIYFENKDTAMVPAVEVFVNHQLDTAFDFSTFEITEVGFNRQVDRNLKGKHEGTSRVKMVHTDSGFEVETDVKISPSGFVQWYMRTIDPKSMMEKQFPEDVYAGFLPPNDSTHRGEGFLSYRVKLREDLPFGTIVRASADIIFDQNDVIVTDPDWWNTIGSDSYQYITIVNEDVIRNEYYAGEMETVLVLTHNQFNHPTGLPITVSCDKKKVSIRKSGKNAWVVKFLTSGPIEITFTQAGNSFYAPASRTLSFNIINKDNIPAPLITAISQGDAEDTVRVCWTAIGDSAKIKYQVTSSIPPGKGKTVISPWLDSAAITDSTWVAIPRRNTGYWSYTYTFLDTRPTPAGETRTYTITAASTDLSLMNPYSKPKNGYTAAHIPARIDATLRNEIYVDYAPRDTCYYQIWRKNISTQRITKLPWRQYAPHFCDVPATGAYRYAVSSSVYPNGRNPSRLSAWSDTVTFEKQTPRIKTLKLSITDSLLTGPSPFVELCCKSESESNVPLIYTWFRNGQILTSSLDSTLKDYLTMPGRHTYYVSVNLYRGTPKLKQSNTLIVNLPGTRIPVAPEASADVGAINLSWEKSADSTTRVALFRNTRKTSLNAQNVVAGLTDSTYTDRDVLPGKTYYYFLMETNINGLSAFSPASQPVVPRAPAVVNLNLREGKSSLSITWETPVHQTPSFFKVTRRELGADAKPVVVMKWTKNRFTYSEDATTIEYGKRYEYQVSANFVAKEIGASLPVTAQGGFTFDSFEAYPTWTGGVFSPVSADSVIFDRITREPYFRAQPVIYGKYTHPQTQKPMRIMFVQPKRLGKNQTEKEISIENPATIPLCPKNNLYKDTNSAQQFIEAFQVDSCKIQLWGNLQFENMRYNLRFNSDLTLFPPQIFNLFNSAHEVDSVLDANTEYILDGAFFGKVKPSIWIEFKLPSGKFAREKLTVTQLLKTDYKGNLSATGAYDEGHALIRFKTPKKWSKALSTLLQNGPTDFVLVLDSGSGLVTYPVRLMPSP